VGRPLAARAAGRVRIGYQKNGALVIVRQQKLLDPLGVAVDWVEFPSGPPMLEAMNAGAVDFGATGDTPPIFAQAAGAALLYVGAQPTAGDSEAILVHIDSPIHSVAGLRGKRVAFTKGSSAHYMTVKVLASAGLTLADIQPVYLQPPDAGAAFRAGAVDAWSIWDPFYAIAQLEPTTRVLTTGVGIAPSNSFFLAASSFVKGQPASLVTLLQAINQAAAWAGAHPDDLAQVMAQVTGVPLPAQRIAAPRGVYAVQPLDEAIVAQEQGIADLFSTLRIIPAKIDVRGAVWRPTPQQAASLEGAKQ
jgi:aliphatic sulfonates family ABC transporter substrate-binding protein